MSERKCVELTAIYSDGEVVRMTGDYIMVASVGPLTVDPMRAVTGWATVRRERPLRRVTVVRGRHVANDEESYIEADPRPDGKSEGYGPDLGAMLPDAVAHRWLHQPKEMPLCDFRIVVEAVPVDEVKP